MPDPDLLPGEDRPETLALISSRGDCTRLELRELSIAFSRVFLGESGDLRGERIALFTAPDIRFVLSLLGIWRAGGAVAPLGLKSPPPELRHILGDAGVKRAVTDKEHRASISGVARELGIELLDADAILEQARRDRRSEAVGGRAGKVGKSRDEFRGPDVEPNIGPDVELDEPALLLYTSGTTARPKGVVSTHRIIRAQTDALLQAWEWSDRDRILNVLPLHHAHGFLNVVVCALRAGACLEMETSFDARRVWTRLASGEITLFMAVPTIYAKLLEEYRQASEETRRAWAQGAARLRLMVSGSAALPARLWRDWREITGQTLLERYGMTEIGMALSNPYRGERLPGRVGSPLPGVSVRLVDESGREIQEDGLPGELQVRGPTVFLEYYNQPEQTAKAFQDDWFLTGDLASRENGTYRILGRISQDIIKSGGYKISALEIEEALREHPAVKECAVLGLPDEEWGEKIAAAIVPGSGESPLPERLTDFVRERLAPYKLPRRFLFLDELPKNAMGKTMKPALREMFSREISDGSA